MQIHVPKPAESAMQPNRRVSSLLKAQIEHLHHAERRLPLRYQSAIYVNAITTEREAANYIRQVTEAIHKAHQDAAAKRAIHAREESKSGLKRSPRKRTSKAKRKAAKLRAVKRGK